MEDILGEFVEPGNGDEYLIIHFSPSSLPLQQRWRNSGLSADFLAEYWATFFPAHDVPSRNKQVEIRGGINYIANELLENIMKFCFQPADQPVSLGLYLFEGKFRFYASNAIDPDDVLTFQARINRLLTKDTQTLYLEQIEKNVSDQTNDRSQLGLLTMINDYQARLAWKFETISQKPRNIIVTTMVELSLS